jgi:hypothetical protein
MSQARPTSTLHRSLETLVGFLALALSLAALTALGMLCYRCFQRRILPTSMLSVMATLLLLGIPFLLIAWRLLSGRGVGGGSSLFSPWALRACGLVLLLWSAFLVSAGFEVKAYWAFFLAIPSLAFSVLVFRKSFAARTHVTQR